MADPVIILDPASQSSGSPLDITSSALGYGLVSFSAPAPPAKFQWASSVDTEGSALASSGHENRTVTISMDCTSDSSMLDLQEKVAKLHREGGTMSYSDRLGGSPIFFDVLASDGYEIQFDMAYYVGVLSQMQFSLTCKPYARGTEVDLGDNVETTLPALVFTEATIAGDVPALGRLVIDNDATVAQWWLTWGIQSRYYSSASSAALFYQAESLTALGGSAIAAGTSSPSGAGSNVMQNTGLYTNYQAVLSTQATGGGAHMTHVGTFRVYGRFLVPTTNTGDVTVALEWSEGDYSRAVLNAESIVDRNPGSTWRLVDLGLITTRLVTSGTQRWEGRILAKSTVTGDDLQVDYLMFVPIDEGSGIAAGVARATAPSSYLGVDEFTATTAGTALNGRVANVGGTWATSGEATDFAFSDDFASENVKRTATSAGSGRFAILGSTNYTTTAVETTAYIGASVGSGSTRAGVIARWVDSSNYLRMNISRVDPPTSQCFLEIYEVVAGVSRALYVAFIPELTQPTAVWVRAAVFTDGRIDAWVYNPGSDVGQVGPLLKTVSAFSSAAATGGALQTGKPGLFDYSATGTSRYYDQFHVWTPVSDAAIFASQSMEIRSDRVTREDSTGAGWYPVSSYNGDYLTIPPSGAEARTMRAVVKYMRAGLNPEVDSSIDDISAKLFVTPRYLVLPS
jgi:hypothetical protein